MSILEDFSAFVKRVTLNEQNETVIKAAVTKELQQGVGYVDPKADSALQTHLKDASNFLGIPEDKSGYVALAVIGLAVGGVIYFIRRKKGG